MSAKKLSLGIVLVALTMILVCIAVAGCATKEDSVMVKKADIAYLDEIQSTGNLTFEWIGNYYSYRPTAVIFPGESDGTDFSAVLGDDYVTKKELEDKAADGANVDVTAYTVEANIGYKAEGINRNLAQYWTKTAEYNLAIFHWEDFAIDENPDNIVAKFYSLPKMGYYKEAGVYETNHVPNHNLTEVVAALYYDEFATKADGKEIRFIGNGVGADLALSVADYLSVYSEKGEISKDVLPSRISLCDPYMSIEDMHMPKDKLSFVDIATKEGMISVVDKLVEKAVAYGAVVEMVETEEVSGETVSYAYDIEKSEKARQSFQNILSNVTHLYLRESYSTKFSDSYKAQKRVALDWYLYSIIGSDDSGNAGSTGNYAAGYPRSATDFSTYFTYDGFNWAPNGTRPMINNRALNNDGTSTTNASSRGKNYSLSAWTPTVYMRALKGISFTQQKQAATNATRTNIHGNSVYALADYTMTLFRSENFQVSDQSDYTLVCGYVYIDKNNDGYINDGFAGIANARLKVAITTTVNSITNTVAEFDAYTDNNGFYTIRLNDKTTDSEGKLSKEGYAFTIDHKLTITFVPSSHAYYTVATTASGPFYNTVAGDNFSSYEGSVTLSKYYANAIKVANCLVRPNKD